MHTTRLQRALQVSVLSVAVLATLAVAQPADAATADTIPTGADRAAITAERPSSPRSAPRAAKGDAAVRKLGRDIERRAAESNLSTAQVVDHLRHDHTLEVDESGSLQVADQLGGTGATISTGSSNTLIWPVGDTLYLHSNPSSPLKIYMDFNGHTTTGTQWNTTYSSFTTPVWGRDGDATMFNTSEAAAIQQSFASVAEDFAPFNVDVTTQDPGIEALRKTSSTDTSYGIRLVVGRNTWLPVTNSGYAKIGSFNWSNDTPAYCFADATTPTKQIAECISHEVGHTVGLLHDGTTTGSEYYAGHANWAPIMGNSYGKAVTQWSRGQYPGANNGQDDLSIIGSYLGWLADDYVGTTATTATLPAGTTRSGRISWGSGEYDAFKFSLGVTRTVNIQSWEWFQAVDPDLNMRVQLTNSAGTVITTASPTGNTRTNMTITLAPGTYYVFLDGVGEGTTSTGYTNYASMGMYNLLLQFV